MYKSDKIDKVKKNNVRYTKEYLLEKSLKVIEEHSPTTIDEMISFIGCSRETFYKKIQVNSKEYEQIFSAIKLAKLRVSNKLKAKILESDNPTLIISGIKLYGSEEDKQALNQNINVNANTTVNYEDVKKIELNINKLSIEEQKQLNALLEKIKKE